MTYTKNMHVRWGRGGVVLQAMTNAHRSSTRLATIHIHGAEDDFIAKRAHF